MDPGASKGPTPWALGRVFFLHIKSGVCDDPNIFHTEVCSCEQRTSGVRRVQGVESGRVSRLVQPV